MEHTSFVVVLQLELRSVQFSSVQSLDRLGRRGDMRDDSAEILFQFFFFPAGPCEQFWHGQGCSFFDVVLLEFPLLTMALPTLEGALKDGFGEAEVACNMPEPCKFSSLDSRRKRFLCTHKEVDLAPQSVVGLAFQVGDAEKFSSGTWFRKTGSFFQIQQAGSMFHSHRGGWRGQFS